jgi:hypothetical protein
MNVTLKKSLSKEKKKKKDECNTKEKRKKRKVILIVTVDVYNTTQLDRRPALGLVLHFE